MSSFNPDTTPGSHQGVFSATSAPTVCDDCDNTAKKIYYTKSLEEKQALACVVCAAPTVIDESGDKGTCVNCPKVRV